MIEVGPLLSLSGAVNTTDNFCKNISIIWHGQERTRILHELAEHHGPISSSIEWISDQILYAPNLESVQDLTQSSSRLVTDPQELRASLESIQRSLGGGILSSAMILTPDKMHHDVTKNPWDALMGVRPAVFFSAKIPYEGMLLQFEHSGVCYLGWHMRVALQRLFNCVVTLPTIPDNTTPPLPVEEPTRIITPVLPSFMRSIPVVAPSTVADSIIPPLPKLVTPGTDIEHYRINRDGTVIDLKTNLMWQRCSQGQVWNGTTCEGEPSTMPLERARAVQVKQTLLQTMLNKPAQAWPSFAGYDDWRLPTVEELRSITWCSNGTPQEESWKYGCGGTGNRNGTYQKPTLCSEVFPNTPPWQFWTASASAYTTGSSRAWVVYFGGGCVNDFAGTYNFAVRLVRNNT